MAELKRYYELEITLSRDETEKVHYEAKRVGGVRFGELPDYICCAMVKFTDGAVQNFKVDRNSPNPSKLSVMIKFE
jgi:hypothetical protein